MVYTLKTIIAETLSNDKIETAITKLKNKKTELTAGKIRCIEFIEILKEQSNALIEFDESLWNLLIQSINVHKSYLEVFSEQGER